MKTILVSGSQGFLGRHLVRRLIDGEYRVIGITSQDIDLTKKESVDRLLCYNADYIFHVAGKVGVVSSWNDFVGFYEVNVTATLHLLEYARIKGIPLHYVSAYVYGNQVRQPISEQNTPFPNNPYAQSKWMAEELCQFYCKTFSVPVTISRPFNIYGEGQQMAFFIPKLIHQISHEELISINDGSPKRDYIYVEDVAEALISIMKNGKNGSVYNIGTGVSYSCNDLISILQKILKTNKKVKEGNIIRHNEIPEARADITKIQTETKWRPKYNLEEGLSKILFP